MALSDQKGKFALATSFAVMTASSTVFAQINASEDSLEGSVVTEDAARQTNQTTISTVRGGYSSALRGKALGALRTRSSGKKFGGPALRETTQSASTDPFFFGPKLDTPADENEIAFNPNQTGLAAGESGLAAGEISELLAGYGTWINVGLSTSQSRTAGTTTDTDLGVIAVGIDRAVSDQVIAGLALSISASRSDSSFSAPVAGGLANLDADGDSISISPYLAYILNENVYFDGLIGLSGTSTRLNQSNAGTGVPISTGRQRSTSQFAAISANYIDIIAEDYGLVASATLTWAQNLVDDMLDDQGVIRPFNDDVSSQFIIGAQVGRAIGDGDSIPYVFSYLEHDLSPSPRGGANGETPTDSSIGLRLGAGVDTAMNDSMTFSIDAGALFLKEDYLEFGGTLNFRWDF